MKTGFVKFNRRFALDNGRYRMAAQDGCRSSALSPSVLLSRYHSSGRSAPPPAISSAMSSGGVRGCCARRSSPLSAASPHALRCRTSRRRPTTPWGAQRGTEPVCASCVASSATPCAAQLHCLNGLISGERHSVELVCGEVPDGNRPAWQGRC